MTICQLPYDRYTNYFFNVAKETAKLSYATRLKVGAVAVRDRRIICVGFNGTPPGEDNCCEDEHNATKPNVIHAEDNLIRFANRCGISLHGCDLYITHSPCKSCAKLLYWKGFAKIYFLEHYRCTDGLEFLESVGIPTIYSGA